MGILFPLDRAQDHPSLNTKKRPGCIPREGLNGLRGGHHPPSWYLFHPRRPSPPMEGQGFRQWVVSVVGTELTSIWCRVTQCLARHHQAYRGPGQVLPSLHAASGCPSVLAAADTWLPSNTCAPCSAPLWSLPPHPVPSSAVISPAPHCCCQRVFAPTSLKHAGFFQVHG